MGGYRLTRPTEGSELLGQTGVNVTLLLVREASALAAELLREGHLEGEGEMAKAARQLSWALDRCSDVWVHLKAGRHSKWVELGREQWDLVESVWHAAIDVVVPVLLGEERGG